jgi:ABC-type uncharacterized transport system ATPase subunit
VLRNADPAGLSDAELVEAMVGRAVPALPRHRKSHHGDAPAVVELRAVSVAGDRGHAALQGVDLDLYPGELVGVAGVAGSGQRELCEVILGLRKASAGTVRLAGRALHGTPRQAIAAGAVGVPEDPITDAVVPGLTVLEHLALGGAPQTRRRIGVDWRAVSADAEHRDATARLRMAPRHRVLGELSGGNVQRVVLTRAMGGAPATVMVAAYPSRGLDIATTRRTQQLLIEQRDAGAAVLVVSEDLDELLSISDRIAVLHDGHLAGVVRPGDTDRYAIGQLMLGGAAA